MNVAICLTRLQAEVTFLGTLSNDAFGTRLVRLLEKEGVPRSPARRVEEPTRLAVVDHTNRAAPFRFYGDNPADAQLSRDDVKAAIESLGATGLYAGSLQLAHPQSRSILEFAIQMARAKGIAVYSDPNPRPAAWPSRNDMVAATEYLLSSSTLAKLSLDDAAVLGWPNEPEELLRWAENRFDARLFVTAGAQGCLALIGGDLAGVRPPDVTPVDPTGAGDASFAALISRFHPTQAIERADLEFAATVGALATLRQGAVNALPTLQEVEEAATLIGTSTTYSSSSSSSTSAT
jgi:sugar/nucleoside kinase (ribokinase family)